MHLKKKNMIKEGNDDHKYILSCAPKCVSSHESPARPRRRRRQPRDNVWHSQPQHRSPPFAVAPTLSPASLAPAPCPSLAPGVPRAADAWAPAPAPTQAPPRPPAQSRPTQTHPSLFKMSAHTVARRVRPNGPTKFLKVPDQKSSIL